jgi:hypothetical protein
VGAGTASALVTTSKLTITSPAGSYLIDDQVTPAETISVGGTTDGVPGDLVDVNCYSGSGSQPLATGVPVDADHSFSFTGSMRTIARATCVLRAVPSGVTTDYPPGSASPFAGPVVAIGQATSKTVPSGPNAGKLEFYYLYVSQLRGAFEYATLGGCSISESYAYDPVTFGSIAQAASESVQYCNAWFSWKNGYTAKPGLASPTRSELQVDGLDAYVAGNAWALNPGNGFNSADNSGFPALSYAYSIDPSNGNLALDETDEVVRCSPGGLFPPTASGCSSFVPTGVQVHMHIVQDQGGRVATVIQYFSSTDGAAHHVDLLENNDFYHRNQDGELDFPWTGAGLQPYTTIGQVLPGPTSPGPGSFFVKGSASVPDGSESGAQGAVTFSSAPSSETIIGTTNNNSHFSWVELHYTRTVPATGFVTLGFGYAGAFSAAEVAADAAGAEAAFRPSVAISSPRPGSVTAQRSMALRGVASDVNGLSTVTVNGHPVTVTAGGGWSTTAPLKSGINTITAVATNMFGNTVQSQTTLIYIPPPVLTRVLQAHRSWREGPSPSGSASPVGTTFRYTLSAAARVSFTFTRQATGRRVGAKCVAENRRNRRRASCLRTIIAATRKLSGHAGRNSMGFRGATANGRRVPAGRYTVVITAISPSTGARSTSKRLSFTIVQ